ncbi:hypothetical protein F8M41_010609 [Gigaspora margarita]|uniref:Uncharacterized protein n=1 Tax=Gigaspora margarita TaxID=4874 RepID=A0A8H4B434_GIGMA|nr:hypothetical protein F8M41_010609 [Gigaspora margarita]
MKNKKPHAFRQYFVLISNPNNATNALAVCSSCIKKYGTLEETRVRPECVTSNRANLCQNHLSKCANFKEYVSSEEVQRILNLSVPEDDKNKKKENIKVNYLKFIK